MINRVELGDMVKDVTLYKGGGTANYGGRVSSVVDIGLKNGNTNWNSSSCNNSLCGKSNEKECQS